MALTYSTMMPLEASIPPFSLTDVVSGKTFNQNTLKGERGLLVMFICNHCPYVVHVQEKMTEMANEFLKKGIGMVAISANDVTRYPDDDPVHLKEQAEKLGFNFPYLYDETQSVAKAFDAVCTPDFFLFDDELKCVYRGRMDESSPGNGKPVTGNDLRKAMTDLLEGNSITKDQIPSMGCGIKWKS